MHLNLVIPRKDIQEAEHLATRGTVYQRVNAWQRVRVLWARLVEVREVNAHPPLPIGLFHQDHVRQVLDFPDVANSQ